ncbi:hypothetical protein V5799_006931, partial [Amblyomma americanum]
MRTTSPTGPLSQSCCARSSARLLVDVSWLTRSALLVCNNLKEYYGNCICPGNIGNRPNGTKCVKTEPGYDNENVGKLGTCVNGKCELNKVLRGCNGKEPQKLVSNSLACLFFSIFIKP